MGKGRKCSGLTCPSDASLALLMCAKVTCSVTCISIGVWYGIQASLDVSVVCAADVSVLRGSEGDRDRERQKRGGKETQRKRGRGIREAYT